VHTPKDELVNQHTNTMSFVWISVMGCVPSQLTFTATSLTISTGGHHCTCNAFSSQVMHPLAWGARVMDCTGVCILPTTLLAVQQLHPNQIRSSKQELV